MIQEPFRDDLTGPPSKVDGPALPGAQEWNSASLKGREGVGRTRRGRSLADDDGPRLSPGIEPGGIGGLAAVVGCATITNDFEWPSEQKGLSEDESDDVRNSRAIGTNGVFRFRGLGGAGSGCPSYEPRITATVIVRRTLQRGQAP